MELHQLRALIAVVEEGGFSRAAQALHLTQPAVSQQLMALERELGVELIQRAGRLVKPTRAGEILLGYARNITALAERAESALAAHRAERRGRLVLGAGNTTITFRLPPLLREYQRREPEVELIVRAGDSHTLVSLLDEGRLDVALVTTPPDERGYQDAPLFADEIVLLLPGDHPKGRAGTASLSELAGVPSILFARGSGFRRFLDDLFALAGYRPEVVMELDSIEGIKKLVQTGLGLSFLPRIAAEPELRAGELRAVTVPGLVPAWRTTHVVYRRERFPSAPLRA
ncbi:MAG: LysR substrate-binding domain-containing protein, partial [Bacteroidota bacterium]